MKMAQHVYKESLVALSIVIVVVVVNCCHCHYYYHHHHHHQIFPVLYIFLTLSASLQIPANNVYCGYCKIIYRGCKLLLKNQGTLNLLGFYYVPGIHIRRCLVIPEDQTILHGRLR